MRIALIDNMNNNFFSFARYLVEYGIDVDLFITSNNPTHFFPQSDTYTNVSEMSWIKIFPLEYSWKSFFKSKKELRIFNEYDLIVACGRSLWCLEKAGIRVDVFIPYGSDLYEVPFVEDETLSWCNLKEFLFYPINKEVRKLQLKAIQSSRVIVTNTAHNVYADALRKAESFALNLSIPMLYNRYKFPAVSHWDELSKCDFVVFNHSRHIWSSNPDKLIDFNLYGGNKRNDKVIRAFSNFLKETKFKNPILVTFEYGPDVAESKKLIRDLGIEKFVKWMPVSPRKEIMNGLRFANLGIDQLRNGLSGIGGTGYEILASGVPLITHTNGAISNPSHPFYNAPILDILDEDDLLNIFSEYEKNPVKFKELGEISKNWFNENLGSGLAAKYLRLFKFLVSDKSFKMSLENSNLVSDILNG
jgi:glycosyltransferase involved in cell wall biosynthesis